MKLHINKEKKETTSFFGKSRIWWSIRVRFQLDDFEKEVLRENRDLLKYIPLNHHWKSKNFDQSHTLESLINDRNDGMPYCADDNSELLHLENSIQNAAKKLKSMILALNKATEGDSVIEI